MSGNLKVKPAEGMIVPHPQRMRPIQKAGEELVPSKWLDRRLRDGDLVLVTIKKKKAHQAKNKIDETSQADQADDS
jgi:hypothetical protein